MEWNNTFKAMKDMDTKTMIDMPLIPFVEPMDVATDKGNASPAPKPKKKSTTSLYLKFFETAPDGKSRRCRFCKQCYSIATATVIGTVSNEEKAAQAKEDGCHHIIIYTKEDFVAGVNNITSGKGVNLVYDSVGKVHTRL